MSSGEVLLGSVLDPEDDEIEVLADQDGTVVLRWAYGADMVFGPVARDKLRELLARAAMPGQVTVRACCDHCNNREGDPAGHDYTPSGPHDGPCDMCGPELDDLPF